MVMLVMVLGLPSGPLGSLTGVFIGSYCASTQKSKATLNLLMVDLFTSRAFVNRASTEEKAILLSMALR